MSKLCKVKLQSVDFIPLGIRMRYDFTGSSVMREIIVCLGGSVAGIISALCVMKSGLTVTDAGMSYVLISLTLSLVNILPIRGFDGGEIVYSALSLYLLPDKAYSVSGYISRTAVFIFWIVTLRVEMRVGINLSMLSLSVYLIYSAM